MHIPNGFLDLETMVVTTLAGAAGVSFALRRTKQVLEDRQIPFLGVLAAFTFAAQLVNFPVAGGTSGHLLGAALAAILVGPWSAVLIMTTVVLLQALFFQDGGISVLGANILNMAVLAPLSAAACYQGIRKIFRTPKAQPLAVFLAAWLAVMVTALAVSVELASSDTAPLAVVLPAMLGWHLLIGIGEGVLSVIIISYLHQLGLNHETVDPAYQEGIGYE